MEPYRWLYTVRLARRSTHAVLRFTSGTSPTRVCHGPLWRSHSDAELRMHFLWLAALARPRSAGPGWVVTKADAPLPTPLR